MDYRICESKHPFGKMEARPHVSGYSVQTLDELLGTLATHAQLCAYFGRSIACGKELSDQRIAFLLQSLDELLRVNHIVHVASYTLVRRRTQGGGRMGA